MRTMICPVSNSSEFCDNHVFFIFRFEKRVVELIKARALLPLSLPFSDRPTYMTWLCESWGAWVDRKVVDRYLEDGKLSQEESEEIERMLDQNEAVLLPREQTDFNLDTYENDDELIRVNCEQMIVTTTEVHFDCQFKNSSKLLSVSPINIEDLYKAVEETA